METIHIICVNEEQNILCKLLHDLSSLKPYVQLEVAMNLEACRTLMKQIEDNGDAVALVISGLILPGGSGIELLGSITKDCRLARPGKILLTNTASHNDMVAAINDAHIDHCIETPWQPEELLGIAKRLLTRYVVEAGMAYRPLSPILDTEVLCSSIYCPRG